jgi:hypothetical protein
LVSLAPVTVVSAKIYLYQSFSGGDYAIDAYRLLRNWVVSQVTWNEYSTGNPWTIPGALGTGTDRIATPSGTSATLFNINDYYPIDVTADVQNIADGTATYSVDDGWQIQRAGVGEDGAYKQFAASESADGLRPYLEVIYTTGTPGTSPPVRHRETQQ